MKRLHDLVGRELKWTQPSATLRANTNAWMTTYEFKTESGEPVVRYSRVGGVIHSSSKVSLEPSGAHWPELPWIVALGWYLAVKMQDDGAAGAVAAAAG